MAHPTTGSFLTDTIGGEVKGPSISSYLGLFTVCVPPRALLRVCVRVVDRLLSLTIGVSLCFSLSVLDETALLVVVM